jgi:hypothetical protein
MPYRGAVMPELSGAAIAGSIKPIIIRSGNSILNFLIVFASMV